MSPPSYHGNRLAYERQVLRDVGLKSEMERDAFKGCAQRIAATGTAQLAEPGTPAAERGQLLVTAGALARYFVANVSSLHSNNFYEGVGALAWVPATKVQTLGRETQALAFYDWFWRTGHGMRSACRVRSI